MNPGGDFGKRELSPALRNRFTEIWVEPITSCKYLSIDNILSSDVYLMILEYLEMKKLFSYKEKLAIL